jgi:uroporphyrinogen-III synthase
MTIVPAGSGIRLPGRFAATVLTSRNAVPACPPACLDRPVFAVGSATAARAREAGFTRVTDADADAAALPGLIAAALGRDGQTLFLPTGLGQGTELAKALRDQGFRVLRRVAYRAAPVDALPDAAVKHLQSRNLGVALFFSGETARAFVRLVLAAGLAETVADVEAVSISERSAMPLRGLPWRRISVAARPNQDAMLVLMK